MFFDPVPLAGSGRVDVIVKKIPVAPGASLYSSTEEVEMASW